MEEENNGKVFTAAVGFGSHSGRREGVWTLLPSRRHHRKPTIDLPAGSVENVATAERFIDTYDEEEISIEESDIEVVGNQSEEEQAMGGRRSKRSCRDKKEISYREVGEEEIIEDQESEQTDRTEIMVSEEEKETQIRKAVKTQSKKRGARIKIRGTSEEEDDLSISVVGSTRRKKRKASQYAKRGREIKEDKSEEDVLIVEDQEEMGKGKQVMASETAFKYQIRRLKQK